MMAPHVLILDDEENIGLSLRLILEREGYTASHVRSLAEFRAEPRRAGIFLLDVRLPDGNGIDILREIRAAGDQSPVIMISGQAAIADAVEATRHGAFDFLEKPLSRGKVLLTLKNALDRRALIEENGRLRELAGEGRMIGRSPVWIAVVEQAALAARSDARILLSGESGSGKEVIAAFIHGSSPFAAGPFVKVNCAAIPTELLESELFGHEKGSFTGASALRRGKFELADGGSLFLDEAGDLTLAAQAKLLRVLQEGEFHRVGGEQPVRASVRVIAATNRDLGRLAAQQQFREDLYYRLNVVPIRVPSLRERAADIPEMAGWFLAELCRRNNWRSKWFVPEVLDALAGYHWPGNVRELRNVVERMAILAPGEEIGLAAIPYEVTAPARAASCSRLHEVRNSVERDAIARALDANNGNVSAAARTLGIERTNLHKRIRALGLGRS